MEFIQQQKNRNREVELTRLHIGHTLLTLGYLMENRIIDMCNVCDVLILYIGGAYGDGASSVRRRKTSPLHTTFWRRYP